MFFFITGVRWNQLQSRSLARACSHGGHWLWPAPIEVIGFLVHSLLCDIWRYTYIWWLVMGSSVGSMTCTSRSGDRIKMREILWWLFIFYADLLYDWGLPYEYKEYPESSWRCGAHIEILKNRRVVTKFLKNILCDSCTVVLWVIRWALRPRCLSSRSFLIYG